MTKERIAGPQMFDLHPVDKCTEPLYRFIAEYGDIVDIFLYVVTLAAKADHVGNTASKVLDKVGGKLKSPEHYERKDNFRRVQSYARHFSRNLILGMSNNFVSFISEELQAVLLKRPEVLRSSEQVTTREILQFSRYSELTAHIADKKINDLTYGGMKGVEGFIRDRLGIELFSSDEERALLMILTELRNIHTHNRGIANELFIKRLAGHKHPMFSFKQGKPTHVDLDEFATLANNAIHIACRLDAAIAEKFKIKRSLLKRRLEKHQAERAEEMKKLEALPAPNAPSNANGEQQSAGAAPPILIEK